MKKGDLWHTRQFLQKLLAFQISHPLATLVFWVVLAAASVVLTVGRLGFQTSQSDLVSPGNRMMRQLRMADRFSNLEGFVVAVENHDAGRTLDFARELSGRLQEDHEHYKRVFARVDPASLRRWALLYLDERELMGLRENLRDHSAFIQGLAKSPGLPVLFEEINNEMAAGMVGQAFTGFLDEETAQKSPLDLRLLIQILRQMKRSIEGPSAFVSPWRSFFEGDVTDESEEGYFWTEGKKYLLVFVEPASSGQGPAGLKPLNALRETVAAVKADFRDIDAGVTGQKALDEDEKNLAMRDIGLATILSLIGLAVLLIVFWRGIMRPLLAVAVLVIALCVTFGLATLFIGHLNLLSVTFAPMLLGLGIDYAVHWFARYNEERRRFFASAAQALVATMDQVGPAIILAGLCASLSFFPLVLTGFKGLSELGLICSMGLLAATAASLFLLPALIVLVGRFRDGPVVKPLTGQIRPLLKTTRRRTVILLCVAVCASGLSIWGRPG